MESKLPAELQKKVDDCVKYCAENQNHLAPHIALRPALEAWAEKYPALQSKVEAMEKGKSELQARCERMEKALGEMRVRLYKCRDEAKQIDLVNAIVLVEEAMKPLVKLSCMVCKKEYFDTEPQTCCSGRDCGCGGGPIDPIVCSEECYNALPGIRPGEALKGKEGDNG